MATIGFTLRASPQFVVGTTVDLYLGRVPDSGAPTGAAVSTGHTVGSDGTIAFTGLDEVTAYFVYQSATGRYMGFTTAANEAHSDVLDDLVGAADKVPYFTGATAMAVADFKSVGRTLVAQATQALMRTTGLGFTAAGDALVTAADAAAQRAALDLEPGTDVQAFSSELAALAALTGTAYGRALLELADAAAARTAMDLGTIAGQDADDVAITGGSITGTKEPVVTALPGSPATGQVCVFQTAAMAAMSPPVAWRLWYDGTKWIPIGGPPLFDEVVTAQNSTDTNYAALATAGPQITIPVAGDYDIAIGARQNNSSAGSSARMSYDIGGAGASDNDALITASGSIEAGSRERRKTGLAAADALVAKYKVGANTGSWGDRWMRVTPVRLG